MTGALVEEATRRSGLVWLLPGGTGPGRPVWHLWHDGAAHVVTGGAEQPLGEIGDRVLVVVRSKERQADRVVQWWATVTQVQPGTPAWDALVPLLAAARLNSSAAGPLAAAWTAGSRVLTLTPDGTLEPVPR